MFKNKKTKTNSAGLNKKTLLGSLIVVVILLLVVMLFAAIFYPGAFQKKYTALSTINGDFYVGSASSFPFSSTVKLKDAFTLQAVVDQETGAESPQLIPLTNSLWQPESISFYKENIVSISRVSRTSDIGRTIENYNNGVTPQTQAIPGGQGNISPETP